MAFFFLLVKHRFSHFHCVMGLAYYSASPVGKHYYYHFYVTDEETKTQRD